MATKNHKRSMSQPERAFWRDAFLRKFVLSKSVDEEVKLRADFADLAIEQYRQRVTWRDPS